MREAAASAKIEAAAIAMFASIAGIQREEPKRKPPLPERKFGDDVAAAAAYLNQCAQYERDEDARMATEAARCEAEYQAAIPVRWQDESKHIRDHWRHLAEVAAKAFGVTL